MKFFLNINKLGVVIARHAIDRYHGCIVSDSVGLGKTFMGLRLAEQAQEDGQNVLIIVPKSVKDNWKYEIKKYFPDIDNSENRLKIMTVTELSNKDLSKPQNMEELDCLKNHYKFLIIDEAHRFRNVGHFDYDENRYSGTKGYANLMHLKTKGTKYLLLTATPINNSVDDLKNLISIFTTKRMLKNYVPNIDLDSFTNYKKNNRRLKNLKRRTDVDNMTEIEIKEEINEKETQCKTNHDEISNVINEVMVLRTKKNILENYPDNKIGGKSLISDMPHVRKNDYEPGLKYTALYDAVQNLILSLEIPHITLSMLGNSPNSLSGLFRILLFKRLESSIHSFITSLDRLIVKETAFKDNVKKHGWKNTVAQNDGIESIKEDQEISDYVEEVERGITGDENIDKSNQDVINSVDSDLELIHDFKLKYIDPIILKKGEYEDPKLVQLEKILSSMIKQKILIFTQYADTAEYLNKRLKKFAKNNDKSLDCIIGDKARQVGNYEIDAEEKIKRFAPKANHALLNKGEEIDILVSTDTLSEGVNLQDCSIIINYDLPWNPMRIVQRVGRVDRIGSTSRTTVFNIIPNKELEVFLNLLEKLESKIKNITEIVGKESYILSESEDIDPKTIGKKLKDVRESEDYGSYERRVSGQIDFKTDDGHAQKIILLRQKMIEHNLACSHKSRQQYELEESPYSIIHENMGQHTFVLFRVYDKSQNEKIYNIMILKDTISGEYEIIQSDDSKILSLPEISNGVSKKTAKPFKLDEHVDDIVKHFKNKELPKITKEYESSKMFVDDTVIVYNAQKYVSDMLYRCSDSQKRLDSEMDDKTIRDLNYCISKLEEHTVNKQDIFKLNHWYGDSDLKTDIRKLETVDFVKKTLRFVDEYLIESRGYTPPRLPENISYSIICRGASI